MFTAKAFDNYRKKPAGAVISSCKTYRYLLWRIWDADKPMLTYLMLNPTTADDRLNDPTMLRCMRRAEMLGYGGMWVVNLFAVRAIGTERLYHHADPVGPQNDVALLGACMQADTVMCGWGLHGRVLNRGVDIAILLRDKNIATQCFGINENGQPVHPYYLPYDIPPRHFPTK